MISFMNSCWTWVVEHKDAIVGFLTSTNFVAIMGAIFALWRQSKSYKDNTRSLNIVNKNSENVTDMKSKVDIINDTTTNNNQKLTDVETYVSDIKKEMGEFTELAMAKINAMIEVQSLVYSTIKDDAIRQSVNSILVEAKYAEANAKAELEQQIEELKEKLKKATENISEEVMDTMDKVKNVMSVVSETKDSANTTRY